MSKIVTANNLTTGRVVFFGRAGTWVAAVEDAKVFPTSEAAEDGLNRARHDARAAIIVDPFITDGPGIEGTSELSLRDAIRARGPTIDFLSTVGKVA